MCGISGWIDWEKNLTGEVQIVQAMTRSLAHRGPDAEELKIFPHAALGHRRLIVVDPAGGRQPMSRERAGNVYTIVYNGELYNTADLRRELNAYGCTFQSNNSDTEILLLAYMYWGPACVDKLNGIFAFAIWDEESQSLFMARDRLGVKPLFYTQSGQGLLFASELKALLVHPAVHPYIDSEGLAELLVMGPSRTPGQGIFCGIKELKPGHCLFFNRSGLRIQRYWELDSHPHEDDLAKTVATVRELFIDSVRRQLVADVPVGTLLSGGLDSSAITAVAAQEFRQTGRVLNTFSVDYLGNEDHFRPNAFQPDADAAWVGTVADYLQTKHNNIKIDNLELARALENALYANDLPGMADIDASLYLFCVQIKKQVTVALSGECADEIFGGYPWFFNQQTLSQDSFPWIRMMEERIQMLSPEIIALIKPREYLADRYREAVAEMPGLVGEDKAAARIRRMFYLNITRFMPTLLERKDRMSMACGLEVRVPFSDHRLLEYVWNVPWEIKTCNNMPKGLFRQAVIGLLPEKVLARPKSPYPKTHNPDYLMLMREFVNDILNKPSAPLLNLIHPAAVKERLTSSRPIMPQPWFGQLMGEAQYLAYLILLNSWLDKYRVQIK
ncbi:Asparagine synthase, glutamine-hydrolyzing [Syntrophomonas zehnderi OL-4]|uniref:asparagine synthase (glutamine-hydrolyzing) n=1 Tax=Syntrophomonas zehnderi OL-4 TaxID=690567 RepID=A0A0E4GAL4_9FIRM|nr:asparagine synthase (glutamine-hydrolyzing) [Syntrophomonas zehnderi]CFX56064.1 Asparagine synthase, glutamine-hydrolyzing [Syntrophomonas zehnderi OL-4]